MANDISLRHNTALATSSVAPKALRRVFLPRDATVRALDPFTSQGPWWPEHLSDHPDPEDTAALAVFVDASRGLVQQLSLELLRGVPALQHATAPPLEVSQPHTLHPRTAGLGVRHPDGALSFTRAEEFGATTRPHTEPDVFPVRDPIEHFDVESINDNGSATAALVHYATETAVHRWGTDQGQYRDPLGRWLPPLEQVAPWNLDVVSPRAAAWSPDGTQLAVADAWGVLLCNVTRDALIPVRRLLGPAARSVAWSTFGIATGHWNGTVRVWDPSQPNGPAIVLEGHSDPAHSVAWSPDGRVASLSDNLTVGVWVPSQPDAPAVVLELDDGVGTQFAWIADGPFEASADGSSVRVWDPSQPDAPALVLEGHRNGVLSVACAPDGRLASGARDGTVRVWDPSQPGSPTLVLKANEESPTVAWTPDGRLASGSRNRLALVWDPGQPGAQAVVFEGQEGKFWSFAWAPDGRVALAYADTVRVWDPGEPGASAVVLDGHSDWVLSVAWAIDGRLASVAVDGTVRVWEPSAPNALVVLLEGHGDYTASVAWAPDGRLASGSFDDTVRVWDPSEPNAPAVVLEREGHLVSWAPDGRLASVTGRAIRVRDPSQPHAPALVLEGHGSWVSSVAWGPDGRLASGSDDGTVRVCDPRRPTRSLAVPRTFGWDGRRLTVAVAFTPDLTVVALHPFLGTDVAVVLPGSEHVPAARRDAARPARRRIVRADRVATLADGALHIYQPTEGGDVWKATALPGLYPACLAPNVDGDLVLQGPDLRALEALLDAVPTVPPPAWSALPVPFRVVDGQLRALGHDVDLARMSEVHTATPLKDGHWVVAGTDGVLVLVAPDGRHALRFRLRGTDGPRTEPVRQLAVIEDALVVGFEDAEPVRVRLPRFDTPLRIGRGGTPPPAGPRLLAGPVRQE